VWLAFALLVLWANVHGSVLVAAALVALLGASELVGRRRRLRALALMLLPWPCVFVSPYGLSLLGYYSATAGNPLFPKFIEEWGAPTFPTAVGLPFFVTAACALVLVARRPRELTLFELGALALTLVGGLTAERSITWFSYAALLFLPAVLDQCWPQARSRPRMRRLLAGLAATTVMLGLGATASAASTATERIEAVWPPAAVEAVRHALAADPHARVVAAEGSANWLLYELPELRGRIAFDGRFEIYSLSQFASIRNYLRQSGPDWERVSRDYRIVVVDPQRNRNLFRTYRARHLRVLYRGARVAVFDRARRDR
jgi:hypothetical protein